jgi:hypothetical protein
VSSLIQTKPECEQMRPAYTKAKDLYYYCAKTGKPCKGEATCRI